LGHALAALVVGYAVARYIQLGLADGLSWEYSLPLELCHWVMIACVIAMYSPNRLAHEIAYFWGLGGTLQAVLTPEVFESFPSWEYIQFFWGHGAVLLSVVYIMTAKKFRPSPGCVLRMMIAVNVYAAGVGTVNALFGWNYGYLCRPPLRPSLIDYLGPWPWYILSLEGIALLIFCLLNLPFVIGRMIGRKDDLRQ
jgi:hypothetical integral membrane protein (TIGR02206 family)